MRRLALVGTLMGALLLGSLPATAAGNVEITLEQAVAAALKSGSQVRSALAGFEAAQLDLAVARRSAGFQVNLGSQASPSLKLSHQDNTPFAGLDGYFDGFGLADTRALSVTASVDYYLTTGGTMTLGYTGERGQTELLETGKSTDIDDGQAHLKLRQPLGKDPQWQSPFYEVKVAGRQVERAALAVKRAQLQVYLQVTQAFFGILTAQDGAALAAQGIALQEKNLAQVKALVGVGSAGPLEVAAAELELERARLSEAKMQQQLALARRQLANILGVPVDESARAVDVPFRKATHALEQVSTAETEASLDAAQARLALSDAQDALARAKDGLGPQFDVSGTYYSDATWVVGVNAFWSPTRDEAAQLGLEKARRSISEAEAALTDARNAASLQGAQDYYDYRAAEDELDLAIKSVERARQAWELTKARANAGTAPAREVLDAELRYRQAELDRKAAEQKYLLATMTIDARTGGLERL